MKKHCGQRHGLHSLERTKLNEVRLGGSHSIELEFFLLTFFLGGWAGQRADGSIISRNWASESQVLSNFAEPTLASL